VKPRRFIDPVTAPIDEAAIHRIERPHPNLWKYYILCCLMVFPLAPILLPIHWFRYHSMRYRFTAEGVSMSWGVLFRRQILLNYARIQDIHLQSNLVERWLGLGRLLIQTASGSSTAEMTIEGLQEFEAVRDFLYSQMRGVKDHAHATESRAREHPAAATAPPPISSTSDAELVGILREIAAEVRSLRESVEHQAGTPSGGQGHV
jgi:putative membrane protein